MMCGILCLYNQQRNVLDDCGKFNKMLHLLDHRGPDDMRTYFDQHVLLGHCRLSIIDLKGGMQDFAEKHELDKFFLYGFGSHHFYLHQRYTSDPEMVMQHRVLSVHF